MSFARYPRYKDSGVEWLGEVPEGWELCRLKRTVDECRNGIWGDEAAEDEWDLPCVRVADFNRTKLSASGPFPTFRNIGANERLGRILRKGDLLLEKSGGGDLQPVGCVVIYEDEDAAVCSNFIARMCLVRDVDPSFCRYLHSAMYAVRITTRSINQTSGIQNLDQGAYLNERVALPPLGEQWMIAGFLDQETAKIDALIEEQRRLIELLKEKRQAVISHAVTHGFYACVSMKASGLSYCVQLPSHWEVRTVHSLAKVGNGSTPSRENQEYWSDEGYPWLSSTVVNQDEVSEALEFVTPKALAEWPSYEGSITLRAHRDHWARTHTRHGYDFALRGDDQPAHRLCHAERRNRGHGVSEAPGSTCCMSNCGRTATGPEAQRGRLPVSRFRSCAFRCLRVKSRTTLFRHSKWSCAN